MKGIRRGRLLVVMVGTLIAQAQTLSTLYSFQCGTDGSHPYAGLLRDNAGNLYGTTYYGGASGQGTVFKLTPALAETVLYSFSGSSGQYPASALVQDSAGNLYGTTAGGGASGNGVVFMLTPAGRETVLHSFGSSPADGSGPLAGLVTDPAGNFYGTTFGGGASGFGTVFKVTPAGVETVLHSFAGADGSGPAAPLVIDSTANLYGTTLNGGASGLGVVFSLPVSGAETVLHSFAGGQFDGAGPAAGLIRDGFGNLYGTAYAAGSSSTGIVFMLRPSGQETVLFNFDGHNQGRSPAAAMILDSHGNLFGLTEFGGTGACQRSGCGLLFQLTKGKETVLHYFAGSPLEGANPYTGSALIADSAGNLYGTTANGGARNCGTVFKWTPAASAPH